MKYLAVSGYRPSAVAFLRDERRVLLGLQADYDTAWEKVALADVLARIHRFEPTTTNTAP